MKLRLDLFLSVLLTVSSSTYWMMAYGLTVLPHRPQPTSRSMISSFNRQRQHFPTSNHHNNEQKRKTPLLVLHSSSSSLTAAEERAKDIFVQFADTETGTITSSDLYDMLQALDLGASEEDANALFTYLDNDGDGALDFVDFLPWYSDAANSAMEVAQQFQALLIGRRTVDVFDPTPVRDDVLERAVLCAINAPNRSRSEPWRFIQVGPETVAKFAELNTKIRSTMETQDGLESSLDWTTIPGWCVVTTKVTPDNPEVELEDFKSTSCAVQNFMLSMWSEGIGTKWTSGPVQKTTEFAHLCHVDTETERVIGCIWYGFATGGLINADPKRRKKAVSDVLSQLP